MIAYAWRSGEIGLGRRAPHGTISFAQGPGCKLRRLVEARSRRAYDNKTLLVPGVPEADTDTAALEALKAFGEWIKRGLSDGGAVAAGPLA